MRYLQKSFKEIVCASPKKIQELHNNIIARQDYEQIKKEFKYIYSPTLIFLKIFLLV